MARKVLVAYGSWCGSTSEVAAEIAAGRLRARGQRIVAVCTGHGLKDPDILTRSSVQPIILPPHLERLEEVILRR